VECLISGSDARKDRELSMREEDVLPPRPDYKQTLLSLLHKTRISVQSFRHVRGKKHLAWRVKITKPQYALILK